MIDTYMIACEALFQGGITVGVRDNARPMTGYAVALPGHEYRIVDALCTHSPTAMSWAIGRYIEANADMLAGYGNYLGIWVDDHDMVLDVTCVVEDVADAMVLAVNGDQDAIYCIDTGETIDCPKRVGTSA